MAMVVKWALFIVIFIKSVVSDEADFMPPSGFPFSDLSNSPSMGTFLSMMPGTLGSYSIPWQFLMGPMAELSKPMVSTFLVHGELIKENLRSGNKLFEVSKNAIDLIDAKSSESGECERRNRFKAAASARATVCIGNAILKGITQQVEVQMGCFSEMTEYAMKCGEYFKVIIQCGPNLDCPAAVLEEAIKEELEHQNFVSQKMTHISAVQQFFEEVADGCLKKFYEDIDKASEVECDSESTDERRRKRSVSEETESPESSEIWNSATPPSATTEVYTSSSQEYITPESQTSQSHGPIYTTPGPTTQGYATASSSVGSTTSQVYTTSSSVSFQQENTTSPLPSSQPPQPYTTSSPLSSSTPFQVNFTTNPSVGSTTSQVYTTTSPSVASTTSQVYTASSPLPISTPASEEYTTPIPLPSSTKLYVYTTTSPSVSSTTSYVYTTPEPDSYATTTPEPRDSKTTASSDISSEGLDEDKNSPPWDPPHRRMRPPHQRGKKNGKSKGKPRKQESSSSEEDSNEPERGRPDNWMRHPHRRGSENARNKVKPEKHVLNRSKESSEETNEEKRHHRKKNKNQKEQSGKQKPSRSDEDYEGNVMSK